MDPLLDEKELVASQIDEIEIAMISARGNKLRGLLDSLDALESKKDALKAQIKRLKAASGPRPVQAGSAPAPPKPKQPPAKQMVPAKKPPMAGQDKASMQEIKQLETELKQLEIMVLAKEDEERRLRYEVESRKRDLYLEEAGVYDREQALLKLSMEDDPTVVAAVKMQRIARATRVRRRWKNGSEPAMRAVVVSYLKSDDAKSGRARWNLMMDIYTSQKQYLDSLLIVRDKYVVPIQRARPEETGVSHEDAQAFFGTLPIIATFEEDILAALQLRLFSRFVNPSIGDLMLRLSSIFPLYVDFCRNLEDAFAVAARLLKTSVFPKYVEDLFLASGTRVPLMTLMNLPAQRLFQYETILSALSQLVDSGHADASPLRAAHKAAASAVFEVKEFQDERKAAQKMAHVFRRIKDLPENVERPGRRLLLEQDVTLVERKRIRHHMFLFDDIVLLTLSSSSKRLKFVEEIPLLGLRFNSLMDNESVYNGFELQTMKKLWTFVCDSYDAKCQLESVFISALSEANSVSVEGFKSQSVKSSKDSSMASSFGLQRVRLEGEIRHMSTMTQLPKETLQKLCETRFNALVGLLETDVGTISVLAQSPDAILWAAQVLDANGKLKATIQMLARGLLRSAGSEDRCVALLRAHDNALCALVGAAASFLARDWIAGLVQKHWASLQKQSAAIGVMMKDFSSAIDSSPPPFVSAAMFAFQSAARKQFHGNGGDTAAFAFFAHAFPASALLQPERFGLSPSTAVSASSLLGLSGSLEKLMSDADWKARMSVADCERSSLPQLLDYSVQNIEEFRGSGGKAMCKALATAIVLKP